MKNFLFSMKIIESERTIYSYLQHSLQNPRHKEHLVQAALRNLNSTNSQTVKIDVTSENNPHLSFKERVKIIFTGLKQEKQALLNVMYYTAVTVAVVAVSILAFKLLAWGLDVYKEGIYNGTAFIFDNYHLRPATMVDWWLDAIIFYSFLGIASAIGTLASAGYLVKELQDLTEGLKDHLNVSRVTVKEQISRQDLDINELSNQIHTDGQIIDPISGELIAPEDINKPFLIHFGNYLFKPAPLIKSLLAHDLDLGLMKHPLFDRYLFEYEQQDLLDQIESITGIHKDTFLSAFNVYNNRNFKIIMTVQEKRNFELDSLECLRSQMMRMEQFRILTQDQQQVFLQQIKNSEYHKSKIQNLNISFDPRILAIFPAVQLD